MYNGDYHEQGACITHSSKAVCYEKRDESEPSSNLLFTGIIEVQAESRSSWTLCQRPLGANPTKQVSTLPELVVEVRVPRGPSAVEGNRELLVVLERLLPHPKAGKHCRSAKLRQNLYKAWRLERANEIGGQQHQATMLNKPLLKRKLVCLRIAWETHLLLLNTHISKVAAGLHLNS